MANQLVYVGSKATAAEHSHDEHTHSHGEPTDHTHDELLQLRTDANGLFEVSITSEGTWYLRTIHLVETSEDGLTHESNWATLTFGVGSGNEHDHSHSHDHDHNHDEGIPEYIYLIISLLIIALLFFFFRRKK